jgi:hypothetical protein
MMSGSTKVELPSGSILGGQRLAIITEAVSPTAFYSVTSIPSVSTLYPDQNSVNNQPAKSLLAKRRLCA